MILSRHSWSHRWEWDGGGTLWEWQDELWSWSVVTSVLQHSVMALVLFSPLFLDHLSMRWALICWPSGTTGEGQSRQKANPTKLSLMFRWDAAVGWRICELTLHFRQLQGSRRRQFHLWMTFLNLKYIYVVRWFVGGVLSDSRFFHSCLPVPSSPMEEKMLFHLGR